MLHSTVADTDGDTLLAAHPRAIGKGTRVVDDKHWGGLPDGKNRRVTTSDVPPRPRHEAPLGEEAGPLQALTGGTQNCQCTAEAGANILSGRPSSAANWDSYALRPNPAGRVYSEGVAVWVK